MDLKYGDRYWFISPKGNIGSKTWAHSSTDRYNFDMGNVFPMRCMAQQALVGIENKTTLIYNWKARTYYNFSSDNYIIVETEKNLYSILNAPGRIGGAVYFDTAEDALEALKCSGVY